MKTFAFGSSAELL